MPSLLDLATDDAKDRGQGTRCGLLLWWKELDSDLQKQVIEVIHATYLPKVSRVKVLRGAGCSTGEKQIGRHMSGTDPCARCTEVGLQVT